MPACDYCNRYVRKGARWCADCDRAMVEAYDYEGSGQEVICAHGPRWRREAPPVLEEAESPPQPQPLPTPVPNPISTAPARTYQGWRSDPNTHPSALLPLLPYQGESKLPISWSSIYQCEVCHRRFYAPRRARTCSEACKQVRVSQKRAKSAA